ncbi:ca2+ sensor protein [Sphingomonas sp. LB-2]|uniref:ca2+ sensor protein n=1 Tax=Sphingomonas caeni TaxID=2984949 RepID=UPI002232647D|nr:ca2+ sensor protein [Sphingomonas caeni]MCW3847756.1 ca2+ sensor protein [Sphingomonas caeni]
MKTKLIAAALAATALAGGAALAQTAAQQQDAPPPPPHGGMLMHADANKDGIVTRQELLAAVDQHFAKVDANHDGKIDQAERQAMHDRMGGRGRHMRGPEGGPEGGPGHGPRVDANNDGVVTLEEARAPALKFFAYVDRNNDGQIDKAEREAFHEAAMAMHGPGGPGGGPFGRHGRHGPPPADAPPPPGQ